MKLHLRYSDRKTQLRVGSEAVDIKPYQIVVWVSIALRDTLAWDPRMPRLPAILDPGNNHNFSISEEHLVKWAGIQPGLLEEQRKLREKTVKVPIRAAGLWLHGDDEVLRLKIDDGIAVFPEGPRLPLLGLRALTLSKLQALLYCDRKSVLIRTPKKWYWPF